MHGRRLGPRSTVRGVGEVTTHQVTLVQLSVVTVSGVVSACVAPCLACNVLGSWGAVCTLGSQAPLSKDPRVARVGGTGLRGP